MSAIIEGLTLEGDVMTVLADFAQILGNQGQLIPAGSGTPAHRLPGFNTGGALGNQPALLMFLASDLNGSAAIFINGHQVGAVFPTGTFVSTQMASFARTPPPNDVAILRSDNINNTIELRNVTEPFRLRNVVCFYHQNS